jgi:sigma-B regulation protein RsbU (phosphoserine phosphatase)
MKILVADDDIISLLTLSARLKSLAHEVYTAENGKIAWELFLAKEPDVVITDWVMPKINGIELCKKIRSKQHARYTYIILLTSNSGKDNFLHGMESGADDFLQKPADSDIIGIKLYVAQRILSLETKVNTLEGLLPMCSYCKNVRNTDDSWEEVQSYVSSRSKAHFTSSYCPDCEQKFQAQVIV